MIHQEFLYLSLWSYVMMFVLSEIQGDIMKIFRSFVPVILLSMLFLALVGHFSTVHAVTNRASAKITVISNADGKTISGVDVIFTSNALPYPVTVRTDSYGVASFPNLPIGDFTLTASSNYYTNSSPIHTGVLTSGQSIEDTFTLTLGTTTIGINFLNPNNKLSDANAFEGTVYWSTYGSVPNHSEMQLQFLDNTNAPVGSVISSVYSNMNDYYSVELPRITVPLGATRMGLTLLNANSSAVDTKTIPLWNYSLHSAKSLNFHDNNPNGGKVDAVITWSGATDESSLAGYNIYYWVMGETDIKYWDTIMKNAEGSYEYIIDSDSFPLKTVAILVKSINNEGKEITSYPMNYVIDNRLSDMGEKLTVDFPDSLPPPTIMQDYTYSYAANTISGQFGFSIPSNKNGIEGYNLYFSKANGDKIKAIGTLYSPSSATQLYFNLDNSLQVPDGATQFALYSYGSNVSGSQESTPVFIPIKSFSTNVPSAKLPQNLSFVDLDEQAGQLRGFLTWKRAADEMNLHSYQIQFLNSAYLPISEIHEVTKEKATGFTFPSGSIPNGASIIRIGIKDVSGQVSSNFASIPISDNQTEDQVQAAVRSAYFPGTGSIDIAEVDAFLFQMANIHSFEKQDVQVFLSLIEPYLIQR